MNAKEYLLRVRKIDKLIENKISEAEHWKSVAMGSTSYSDGDRVQSSGSKQKMADAVARYIDIESEINDEIDLLADIRREIVGTIEQLPVTEYDLLYKVYIVGKELQDVATDMDKSYSWATTVHGRALAHLQKILDEREKDAESDKQA